MADEEENKLRYDALEDLEGLEGGDMVVESNLEVLDEAQRYNVDLDNLEDITCDLGMASIENNQEMPSDQDIEYHRIFKDLDVRLNDIVDKVFKKSDRPFIIVQDDKIQYTNKTFMKLVGVKKEEHLLGKNFLTFVAKEDWNMLAENIGEMLTAGKTIAIKIRDTNNRFTKMKFDGVYLNDRQSFSFILAGERLIAKSSLVSSLYDPVTELPSFYLLEDRVQVAVDRENHKDFRLPKNQIALVGINIDNYAEYAEDGRNVTILKKLASKLVLSLKKSYTVSAGLKYHFWILMCDLENKGSLEIEVNRLKAICQEPISDTYEEYDLKISIGVSVFPDPSSSAKKLLENGVLALDKAIKESNGKVVFFGD